MSDSTTTNVVFHELSHRMHGVLRRAIGIIAIVITMHASVVAQSIEEVTINSAIAVLDDVMSIPANQIPQRLLSDASGVAIVPGVVKGGFLVGLRHGKGVVLVKDEQSRWLPPHFVSLSGGSVGWQAGIQSTDVILVFKTRNSVSSLLQGKLTIGFDAAAAAGPVGRNTSAGTDSTLQAEIYSYSRSRGLFAGVSIDGSALEVDHQASTAYYRANNASYPHDQLVLPNSAVRLINKLSHYSGSTGPTTQQRVARPPLDEPSSSEALRRQLIASWKPLSNLLDDQWKVYLALPQEIMRGEPVQIERLKQSLQRYDSTASHPRYSALTGRDEFSATHALLSEYMAMQSSRGDKPINLPPPPVSHFSTRNRY